MIRVPASWRRRPLIAGGAALLATIALLASDVRAQLAGPAASLRVEWEPEPVARGGWSLEGYVYNSSDYRMSGVRLGVDVLDASGSPEERAFGWVQGDVPPRGRAYFSIRLPRKGASYRVSVLAANVVSRDAP